MADNLDLFVNALNQYVVTPLNAFGLGGFVFDIEDETSVNLQAEITDHYLENNTTVQDHIAIRPKRITLRSFVGELVYREDEESNTFVQRAVQKLTVINSFLPVLTDAARQAVDFFEEESLSDITLDSISLESVNKMVDYWALAKNIGTGASRQQQAYNYFKALMEGKILISVQTPFEFMTNMAIESIVAIQGGNSRFISDFSITLKQIRKARILNIPSSANADISATAQGGSAAPEAVSLPEVIPDTDSLQGRTAVQHQPLNQIGNMPGVTPVGEDPLDLLIRTAPRNRR